MIGYFRLPQTETLPDRIAHRLILRVITDAGITYDEPSLKTTLNDLNNDGVLSSAILVMTPNSSKVSKLYSALPESGVGDFTVSRNSTVWANNKNGILTETPANVPCFEWENGKPHLLTQPQSTNLITYSNDFSDASWFKFFMDFTLSSILSPDGNLNTLMSTSTTNDYWFEQNMTLPVGKYTITVYVKGKGVAIGKKTSIFAWQTGTAVIINGGFKYYTLTDQWQRIEYNFEITTAGTLKARIDPTRTTTGSIAEIGDEVYIYGAQLEQLSYPTSYIPTVGTTVTRLADVVTVAPPIGVTSITETINNIEQTPITVIPTTYTIPNGKINKIVML